MKRFLLITLVGGLFAINMVACDKEEVEDTAPETTEGDTDTDTDADTDTDTDADTDVY